MHDMLAQDRALLGRVEALMGEALVSVETPAGGYSSARRWLVTGASGRSAFVKVGVTPVSETALRREALVYERLHLPCMPEVYGWDPGSPPILLLLDLSECTWPPPWTPAMIDRALDTIDEVHAARAALPSYAEIHDLADDWWGRIAAAPDAFLRLGLVSREWFERNAEVLAASARTISPAGSSVIHFDLRSDNLCFSPTRAYLIDWSHACIGNGRVDLALFLPGLAAEGGPRPEDVLPDQPGLACWAAGCFAWYASKPPLPAAPGVRPMQRRHLEAALPWAVRALGLEPVVQGGRPAPA
jgi:hypothetical protein